MTLEDFIKEINTERKTNDWYSFVGEVEGRVVQLKGYKTWLQRYIVDGVNYANNCDQSVKQFNLDLRGPFK